MIGCRDAYSLVVSMIRQDVCFKIPEPKSIIYIGAKGTLNFRYDKARRYLQSERIEIPRESGTVHGLEQGKSSLIHESIAKSG
jgi:hypothetical protein